MPVVHATSNLAIRDLLPADPVVVRRLSLPFDERLRAHARLLAERLVGLDSPLLVPIREVRPTSDGLELVLEQPEDARPLHELVGDGELAPGQVVTLGVDLAEALAELHDLGLTHGRLRAEDVLVRRDGVVLLTGYGVTAVLGSAGRPADDLRDLLDLLTDLVPGSSPGWLAPMREAVDAGEDEARTVGAGLVAAGPRAQPLPGAVPAGLPVPRPPVARHGAPRHRALRHRASGGRRALAGSLSNRGLRSLALLVPAALGIVLLAGWIGATSSLEPQGERPAPAAEQPSPVQPSGQPSPAPANRGPGTPSPSPPRPPDWRAVLTQLDVARAGVLAAPDEARVADVDAPGSSAYADDLAAVRALESRHAVARGVRFDLQSVRVRSAGQWRADLEVVDALRPHSIVASSGADGGSGGAVLEQRPGRGRRTSVVTLVRTDDGWRVAQVIPQ